MNITHPRCPAAALSLKGCLPDNIIFLAASCCTACGLVSCLKLLGMLSWG